MSIEPGARLGHYEIVAHVGAGGMGEVWRARDTKLGREVAIKVLPEALSEDEAHLARFEREARLLASLNHPNVATLHGLEEHDGTRFLVMELVAGETLSDRISRGPLPIDETLALSCQIAEGLEAAHRQGIVHRDLKPANVKITPEGKAKVLDFGLGKVVGEVSKENELSESPTAGYTGTRAGMILGTASYMSPEQARGKAVDERADIWAFGCLLYEALIGKKAFDGETITDTIASLVKSDPDWEALPAETPWRVRELLARCLRKDPAKRVHSIADARLEIEEAMESPAPPGVERPVAEAPKRSAALVFAAGAALAALLTGLVFWMARSPRAADAMRLTVQVPSEHSLRYGSRAP